MVYENCDPSYPPSAWRCSSKWHSIKDKQYVTAMHMAIFCIRTSTHPRSLLLSEHLLYKFWAIHEQVRMIEGSRTLSQAWQTSQCVCLQSVVFLMHVAVCLWNGCMHVQHFNMSDLSQERMMYEANRLTLGAHRPHLNPADMCKSPSLPNGGFSIYPAGHKTGL